MFPTGLQIRPHTRGTSDRVPDARDRFADPTRVPSRDIASDAPRGLAADTPTWNGQGISGFQPSHHRLAAHRSHWTKLAHTHSQTPNWFAACFPPSTTISSVPFQMPASGLQLVLVRPPAPTTVLRCPIPGCSLTAAEPPSHTSDSDAPLWLAVSPSIPACWVPPQMLPHGLAASETATRTAVSSRCPGRGCSSVKSV